MAVSDLCLACGGAAVSGERRIIGEEGKDSDLTTLRKNLAAKELEKTGENVDLEIFLRHRPGPFFCRKCFRAYGNLMTAMKVSCYQSMNLSDIQVQHLRHWSLIWRWLCLQ